jgi:hypothetical protein
VSLPPRQVATQGIAPRRGPRVLAVQGLWPQPLGVASRGRQRVVVPAELTAAEEDETLLLIAAAAAAGLGVLQPETEGIEP